MRNTVPARGTSALACPLARFAVRAAAGLKAGQARCQITGLNKPAGTASHGADARHRPCPRDVRTRGRSRPAAGVLGGQVQYRSEGQKGSLSPWEDPPSGRVPFTLGGPSVGNRLRVAPTLGKDPPAGTGYWHSRAWESERAGLCKAGVQGRVAPGEKARRLSTT
jgi:hypothetical protein